MARPYSVMTEPVIPVAFLNGSLAKLGIRETLIRAHEIRDLQCLSPLENYALFRLMIAFATDILRPERRDDRRRLLEVGRFDAETVDAYIAACETNGPRFDLFDARHPFMQSAYDAEIDGKAIKPVAALSISLPSGNNHMFLDHRSESTPVMLPDEAFRAMLTLYVFCTAGAQGYPSGVNNTPPVYHRVIGNTLYESIILNMSSSREHASLEDGYDDLPWKNNRGVTPKEEFADVTYLAALTWQPRRICLLPEADGTVRKTALQQGKNFRGNDLWRDPHVAYRCGKKGDWNSVKPQQGRALWRDVGALLADSGSKHYRPPMSVSDAAEILEDNTAPLNIQQIGLMTNQASYVGWVEDRLSLPACILEDDFLAMIIRGDTETVEAIQSILVRSINTRYGHEAKQDISLAEQARLSFLAQMHDVLFNFSIPDVYGFRNSATEDDLRRHMELYHSHLEKALRSTLREVVQTSGSTSRDLQMQVETQREIMNRFRKYITEKEEQYE